MRLSFLAIAMISLGITGFSQTRNLGVFDDHSDIGKNVKPGSAVFIPATEQYVLSGAGYNVWADHDEFHFAWKKMKGDFILTARAQFVGAEGVNPHRKIGWMVRKNLDGNSPHVNAVVHGDGLTSLQYRKSAGAQTNEQKAAITGADIIELERKGNDYLMRVAKYGEPFVTEKLQGIEIGEDVYVGLFVSSHEADLIETGVFHNVRIVVPAPDTLIPYRQSIGSRMEVLEIASGRREVVYTNPGSIQAPNWTPDNKSLLYNLQGLIYTFDFESKKVSVLNTGDVKNNNNDHVLSMDGRLLGLSSGVQALGGSIIYTVPATGGIPKQITPKGPSYLHGWSPDNKHLLFTGMRNGDFDIYRVPAEGGKEVQLTTTKGLDDGSEYSPDGKHIWFNSARNGTMQIFRMNADGSNQVSITDSSFHDWFPHVSPDGKWVVFLSFMKDEVRADDHPFYKHVYLRMIPASGGKPKVIAYFYGGQGSINTPSWSPDSKKLAFISNSVLLP